MKANTKNNPVTVGALLGVLGATLFFLMRQMGGGGSAPVATLTPVVDTHEDAAPRLTQAGASTAQDLRDPFDHPALRRAAKTGAASQSLAAEGQPATDAARSTLPKSDLLPLSAAGQAGLPPTAALPVPQAALPHAPSLAASATAVTGADGSRAGASSGRLGNAPTGVQEAEDPLKGWRLTAIIAGRTPRAVIEGAGKIPILVGMGERVNRLCVTAIQEREIVLRDANHLYTLPLTIAPASPEDSKDSDKSGDKPGDKQNDKSNDVSKDIPTPADSLHLAGSKTDIKDITAEANLNAARETLNVTAKKHP